MMVQIITFDCTNNCQGQGLAVLRSRYKHSAGQVDSVLVPVAFDMYAGWLPTRRLEKKVS